MRDLWLLAGDFNDIAFAHEKKGGAPIFPNKCKKFRESIDKSGLIDMGVVGSRFTRKGLI